MSEVALYRDTSLIKASLVRDSPPLGPCRRTQPRALGGQVVFDKSYRDASLIRKHSPLGPYCRPMPRVLGESYGGGCFLMGEVPLYRDTSLRRDNLPP